VYTRLRAYEPFGGRIALRTGVSHLKRKRKVSPEVTRVGRRHDNTG